MVTKVHDVINLDGGCSQCCYSGSLPSEGYCMRCTCDLGQHYELVVTSQDVRMRSLEESDSYKLMVAEAILKSRSFGNLKSRSKRRTV